MMRRAMSLERRARSTQSGFILVAVLWIVAALATLASIYSIYTVKTAAASHIADERLQAEQSIRAGVELAAYQVLAAPEAARPTHGAFNASVGRTKITVRYRSEGGRIDLNAAPKDLLVGLFASVGAGASEAATYADRVIGWRKKAAPNVEDVEAAAYKTAGIAYAPRQAAFNNVLELALVMGLPAPVVERVLPEVTVFSGKPLVDVVNADAAVLDALPGMTRDILHEVLAARAQNPSDGKALMALMGPARGHATIEGGKALRVTVQVDLERGRRVEGEVVFVLADSGEDPFDIVYWRDDFDGPF
jgi:general secretion pathway protein K